MSVNVKCATCGGTGIVIAEDKVYLCPECVGHGYLEFVEKGDARDARPLVECLCEGDNVDCPYCHGSGSFKVFLPIEFTKLIKAKLTLDTYIFETLPMDIPYEHTEVIRVCSYGDFLKGKDAWKPLTCTIPAEIASTSQKAAPKPHVDTGVHTEEPAEEPISETEYEEYARHTASPARGIRGFVNKLFH